MLSVLAISGYRTLRNLLVPLKRLNLITGANGSGKSNLYRAMRLLADAAQGHVVQSLAHEGGLQSTLWAGPDVISRSMRSGEHPIQGTARKKPVSLRLGFAGDEFGYAIDLGLPPQVPSSKAEYGLDSVQPPPRGQGLSMFALDPEIKRECIWHGERLRPSTLLVDRRGPVVRLRRENGSWDIVAQDLAGFDSMMARLADPRNAPEVMTLRDLVRGWRFYDHFRADGEAPARSPQVGTFTPVLSNDGRDLAAAIATICEIGDQETLNSAVEDAFPGSRIDIESVDGRFTLRMKQHGLLRPLAASELSDGTLRYLLWIAVLLTPRPPELMVLNEPETSLHPDLLPALARLIAHASEHTQVIAVSHAPRLITELTSQPGCRSIRLEKQFGETAMNVDGGEGVPSWQWPGR